MNTNTTIGGRGRASFPFVSVLNSVSHGDVDGAEANASVLNSMALSVLNCLYSTLSEESTRGSMTREEVADVVAVAAGMLELSDTVGNFVRDNREDAL